MRAVKESRAVVFLLFLVSLLSIVCSSLVSNGIWDELYGDSIVNCSGTELGLFATFCILALAFAFGSSDHFTSYTMGVARKR